MRRGRRIKKSHCKQDVEGKRGIFRISRCSESAHVENLNCRFFFEYFNNCLHFFIALLLACVASGVSVSEAVDVAHDGNF